MITHEFDWPGWPLEGDPYGGEFDAAARKRMVEGSRQLLSVISRFRRKIGNIVLEVGPFFNPIVTPKEFRHRHIFYWENDRHVLKYLAQYFNGHHTHAMYCDLNKIDGPSLLKLKSETLKHFHELGLPAIKFDAVIASHVLNYIDYRLFLMVMKDFLTKDGLIFINNVVNYGLPAFFSEQRPKSIAETVKTIQETGYEIVTKVVLGSPSLIYQQNKRLLIVAKNAVK